MPAHFHLQGHRGARGLKPENTLPGFELAFDLGVTSVETDVHLSCDGIPVLIHDPIVTDWLCRLRPGQDAPNPATRPLVSKLTLQQLRGYSADLNPDSRHFPGQDASVTPLARLFADETGMDPYAPPALADLFAFAAAYAGELGVTAGKSEEQRRRVRSLSFDLELKRVPFRPEYVGDEIDPDRGGLLERQVLACVRAAGVVPRTTIRSFDHRAVRVLLTLEPSLTGAILIAGTAPITAAYLLQAASASVYCPDFEFVDSVQIDQLHRHGFRVLPWTVNELSDGERLLAWGVDGITTDYPDRLAELLRSRGIAYSH